MSEFEDLDPAIEKALRDIPPASASLRDAHIAAALGEMAPSSRRAPGRLRIVGSVAAAAVVAVAGLSVLRQNSSNSDVVISSGSTLPPKTGATCATEFAELLADAVHSEVIVHENQEYAVVFRDDNIDVYQATQPCARVGTIEYRAALVARDNEQTESSGTAACGESLEVVHRFADNATGESYKFVLVQTDGGLSLIFEDRCNSPIASLDLP